MGFADVSIKLYWRINIHNHQRQCFKHEEGIQLACTRHKEPPSEEEDNDNNAENNQSIDSDSPIEDELYINRISCFAHTLQLTVSDGLKQAKQMNPLLKKVGKIVCHVKKSTTATKELDRFNSSRQVCVNQLSSSHNNFFMQTFVGCWIIML